jgi:hypothetical protein
MSFFIHELSISKRTCKIKGRAAVALSWLVIVVFSATAYGAFELDCMGPRATALGGGGAALTGDGWAGFRNPALIVDGQGGMAGSWSQQFGLPELSREAVAADLKFRCGNFAVLGGTFGSDLYRETQFGLAAAKRLHPKLAAGIEIGGRWLDIEKFSAAHALSVTAGLLLEPMRGLAAGIVWRNLNEPRLTGYVDRLPSSLTFGLAGTLTKDAVLTADIIQDKRFPAEVRVGAEASVMDALRLRVGMRAEPVRPSAGFDIQWRQWRFHYGGDLHPDLGASHEMGLEFLFGK